MSNSGTSASLGDGAGAKNLRVTHVVKGLGPGGAERLIVNQVTSPASTGVVYRVITLLSHKDHLVAELHRAGIEVICVGYTMRWPLRVGKLIRTNTDIVHVHSPLVAGVLRLLRVTGRYDAALVTTEHNRWPRHHRATRLLNRATARFDDARIAVSDDVVRSMPESAARETRVIRHGIGIEQVAPQTSRREEMRAEFGLGDDTVAIGIVANFRPEKAYDTFLSAVVAMKEAASPVHFVVVGQGPGEEAFRAAVRDAKLDSRVTITGYREDASAVMAAFDVFTLTSRHEGLPVSLMEAFALGLPVVATRAGGIPEAVTNEREGLLVPIDDVTAVAEAWAELVDDPSLRRQMGHAAREASADFDAAVSTREIESLYRRLITGSE